ncbi:MAG TPA: helix-turn-helix domain-containing protein [Gaiellaceae bacterium]|jgi:sugar diacid utilization regulator|nr:helix-turn-helix domain-containing protein [Gaiellaceae bacterium]
MKQSQRPEANAALAEVAARIRDRKEALAQQFLERLRKEVVDYRFADDDHQTDLYAFTLANIDALLDDLETGDGASDAEFERVRSAAARRAHEVPLEALERAWRLFGQTAWTAVLETVRADSPADSTAALQAAARLLRHVDAATTAGIQAYLDELQNPLSDLGLLRRDLLEALVSGGGEPEQIRRRAQALHVRLADGYVVVVMRDANGRTLDAADLQAEGYSALRRIVEGVRAHLTPLEGPLLVGIREREVVVAYPLDTREGVAVVRRECAELSESLIAPGINIGISGWHAGSGAIAAGYAEARAAERLAEATGDNGHALTFDEVLIDHIVRSSPAIERALTETLRPLVEYDLARQANLVGTLRAFVDAGFNITKSAAALHAHPNTVAYRLHRIEQLTGREVHDVNDLLVLVLSLKHAALTGS